MVMMRDALALGLHHIFVLLVVIAAVTLFVVLWLPRSKPETVRPAHDLKEA
jgi:hypothetical protein